MSVMRLVHAPWWYCALWTGRVTAVLLGVGWLALLLAEGPPEKLRGPIGMWIQFVALVALFAAYLLGWRKALAGGLLGLAALALFCAAAAIDTGIWPQASILLFGVPALLYLAAYALRRHAHH